MTDKEITETVFSLLHARAPEATICPSDVARALEAEEKNWRKLMPEVRRVAASLAAQGQLRVTRKGVDVDAMSKGGPIRLGRLGRLGRS